MYLRFFFGLFFLSLFLFQGCSGLKPYPRQDIKNITISTKVDSGSFFSSVNAEVDIHSVDTKCRQTYEGTLSLDKDSINSGLRNNKKYRVSFVFSNSSFLGNSSSSISFPIYLKTRKGYSYDFIVSYKDNIYNVELFETDPKTKRRRELDTDNMTECQAQ